MISLNATQFGQSLNDRGWYIVRQRGSHARWYNPESGKHITVPMHGSRAIPRGTLHALLKDAGIDEGELLGRA